MHEVILTEEAQRTYHEADIPLVRKLNRCFENVSRDPFSHPNIKRLTGKLRGLFRYRIGDWRVVYRIDEESKQVVVLVIVHRSGAYK